MVVGELLEWGWEICGHCVGRTQVLPREMPSNFRVSFCATVISSARLTRYSHSFSQLWSDLCLWLCLYFYHRWLCIKLNSQHSSLTVIASTDRYRLSLCLPCTRMLTSWMLGNETTYLSLWQKVVSLETCWKHRRYNAHWYDAILLTFLSLYATSYSEVPKHFVLRIVYYLADYNVVRAPHIVLCFVRSKFNVNFRFCAGTFDRVNLCSFSHGSSSR